MLSEIKQFIDWVQMRNPQAKTWRDYRCDLQIFARVLGDRKIWRSVLGIWMTLSAIKLTGIKPSTVNRRLAAVVSFYRYLIAKGMAETCPVLPKRHYLPRAAETAASCQ